MMSSDVQYYQANRGVMSGYLPGSYVHVLEIGCGAGAFAKHLKRPCEIWGIEPNPEAARLAQEQLDHVLVGTYEQQAAQLPNEYFDLVICNDVIEHMPDHDAFLEAIKAKMRPGAYIVGSIPNVLHITALYKLLLLQDWRYSESGILDRTHLRFFTRRSLVRALREHGYAIQSLEGVGSIIANGISRRTNKPTPVLDFAFRMITLTVVILTLGLYWDTQYPQFAFRVQRQ